MNLGPIAAALVGALLALLLLLPGPDAAVALDPDSAATELVALTNLNRTTNGLAALLADKNLALVALSRSDDMIKRSYFSHQIPPDNHTVIDVLESLGIPFRTGGENIEWNTASEFSTVQYASNDFMNSPSHRANILNNRYNRLGAGVAEGSGRRMYTVVFIERPPTESASRAPRQTDIPQGPPATPREVISTATPAAAPTLETPKDESTAPATVQPQVSPPSSPSPSVQPAAISTAQPIAATVTPLPVPQRVTQPGAARLTLLEAIINQILRLFLNL